MQEWKRKSRRKERKIKSGKESVTEEGWNRKSGKEIVTEKAWNRKRE
jgi:hypothetical protein